MGWQSELARSADIDREVFQGPLVRAIGPVEAGVGGEYSLHFGEIDHSTAKKVLVQALAARLSPREERVLRLLYGFDGKERTLDAVGEEFGVSRERIRQIEAKALRKLKHPSVSRRLRLVLDEGEPLPPPPPRKPYVYHARQAPQPIALPEWTVATISMNDVPRVISIKRWVDRFPGYPAKGPHAIFDYAGTEWVAALSELQPADRMAA